jgi:hypothetical protein
MTGPIVDIGRDLVAFVAAQASFTLADGAGESYPETADALRAITGSAGGTIPTVAREDKFGTATAVPGIPQKRTAEGSLEGYVMPSGTITTAPDIGADLLVKGGWEVVDRSATNQTVLGSGSSAIKVDLGNSTGFAVGDGVLVQTNDTATRYEARRIVGVDLGGTNIYVEPPLTFTPADGKNVQGAIAYKPSDTRDSTPNSLVLWLLNNNSADRISSWTPDSFSFTIGGEDAARFTASGTGKRHDRLFQTTLSTNLDTGVLTMVVSNALASAGDALNTYWDLTDGGNTVKETVKVTAISGTSWTVTRGQLGNPDPTTTWDKADTEITPYRPAGTYAGSPVPSTSGQVVVSDGRGTTTALDLQCNNATLDCGFGTNYRTDIHGTTYSVQGYTMAQREVRATLSGWTLRTTSMPVAMRAWDWQTTNVAGSDSQQVGVVVQTGVAVGGIFAWVAPRMRTEDMSLDRGADEVTLELTGLCEGTSSGADEILLIFG